ncbi:hypothetical protein AACH06_19675 [Ideonella sp. DXS29W]|uniref:Transmembrane protein n=1 Tax=Ideonella lacteola TaxID=2984193 RepID=A0ABU9BTI1_9BURK
MKTFLKGLALLAAITSLVWIVVIWRWQVSQRNVSGDDLALYLVLLPLVLFAFVLALRWAVKGALAKQQAAAVALASAAEQAGAGKPAAEAERSGTEAKERHLSWPVLGAWVGGPAGEDIASVLEAAKASKPAPTPDALLRDFDGLPVLCARSDGVDAKPVEKAWGEWLQAHGKAGEPPAGSGVARALAALAPLLEQAGAVVDEWVASQPADRGAVARVRVLAAWPAQWAEAEVAWARAWLDLQARQLAAGALPLDRWQLQHLPSASGPQAWQYADKLLLTMQREQCHDLLLLVACHSDISQASIDAMGSARTLFSAAHHTKGHMPGEGAAALLLSPISQPEQASPQVPLAWLHRPACRRRDKSIDAAGKTSAEALQQAVSEAIQLAGLPAEGLAGLCCDADRHSARATELFATTIELLPHLDAIEELRLVGVTHGHTRQTGALWAVAGAIHQAAQAERPAIAMSLSDEHWRMAMVVRHRLPDPAAT